MESASTSTSTSASNIHTNSKADSSEDEYNVNQLSQDFASLLEAINHRVHELADATQASVESKHRAVLRTEMLQADEQIAQLNRVLKLCDELEHEFLKIRQIGEIASDFRNRLARVERQLKN